MALLTDLAQKLDSLFKQGQVSLHGTNQQSGLVQDTYNNALPTLAQAQQTVQSPTLSHDIANKVVPSIPLLSSQWTPKPVQDFASGVRNIGVGLTEFPLSVVQKGLVNPAIDVGKVTGATVLGNQQLPNYKDLLSGPAKLAYQASTPSATQGLDVNRNWQETLGNFAQTADPIVGAAMLSNLHGAAGKVTLGMTGQALFDIAKQSALQNQILGTVQGATTALQRPDIRNENDLVQYALKVGNESGKTGAIMGLIGMLTPYATYGGKWVFDKLKNVTANDLPIGNQAKPIDETTRQQLRQQQIDEALGTKYAGWQDVPQTGPKQGQVPQVFNTEKFNVTPEQQNTLKQMQAALGLQYRDVMSFQDMRDLAAKLGTDPQSLLSDIQTNRITAPQVVALGQQINSSMDHITALTEQLKLDPTNTVAQNALDNELSLIQKAIPKRIISGTEAGRAVVAYRIVAQNSLDPTYWLTVAQKRLGKETITPEVINAINGYINNKDTLGLAQFVSTLGESGGLQKALTFWKTGLLTNPATHAANIAANVGMGGMETVKDIPAALYDIIHSAITGAPRSKTFDINEILSQGSGAARGYKQAVDYVKTGIDTGDISQNKFINDSVQTRYGKTLAGRIAQKYTDTIFRLLGGEDKIFREAAFNRSLYEQAAVQGLNNNLTVGEIQNLAQNPTSEMLANATKDSLYTTFNKPNIFASMINGMKQTLADQNGTGSKAGYAALEMTSPFVKTPSNVAESLFDYLPTGYLKTVVDRIRLGQAVTDRQLADAFGRSATGLSVILTGAYLASKGLITGNIPSNPAERAQWETQNKKPNSINLGDRQWSFSRLNPIGNLLTIGAEAWKSGGNISSTAYAGIKSLTDQPFLLGLSNQLQALTNPEQSGGKFVNSAISGFVPSFAAAIARGTDPVARISSGALDAVKARTPVFRNQLPAKISSYGDPVLQQSGVLNSLVNPFYGDKKVNTNDPVLNEMNRVGYNLNYVGDTFNGKKLTPGQKEKYQIMVGDEIKQLLPQVINSDGYKSADLEQQKTLIEKYVSQARSIAMKKFQAAGMPESHLYQSGIVSSISAADNSSATQDTTPRFDPFNTVGSYQKSADSPQNIIQQLTTYAQALAVDPQNALKAMFTSERLRKVTGNAAILERKNYLNTSNSGMIKDHIIPLSLGGDNADSNLVYQTPQAAAAKDKLELDLGKKLASGAITRQDAQKQIQDFYNTYGAGTPIGDVSKIQISPAQTTNMQTKTPVDPIQLSLDKTKFTLSNKPADIINGLYYIRNGGIANTTSVIDLNKQPPQIPTTTGNSAVDKQLVAKYNNDISSRERDLIKVWQSGLITQDEMVNKFNQLEALKSKFSTPKTGKKLKAQKLKLTKINTNISTKFNSKVSLRMPKIPKNSIKLNMPKGNPFTKLVGKTPDLAKISGVNFKVTKKQKKNRYGFTTLA